MNGNNSWLNGDLPLKQDAGGVHWKGGWGLPEEWSYGFGEGLQGGLVGGGGEQGEVAVGLEEADGDGEGFGHLIDGAEGDAGEAGGEGFSAGGVDLDVGEAEGAEGFAEKGGFFMLGFGEGDRELGAEDGDGEARESCSGAEVEKRGEIFGEGAGGEDGFEEVAGEDAFAIADGGEVGAGVPLLEEIEVGCELSRYLDV